MYEVQKVPPWGLFLRGFKGGILVFPMAECVAAVNK